MPRLTGDGAVTIRLVLCDTNPDVVAAWRAQFEKHPDVDVREGDIRAAGTDACICPGNAFGFMDSGLAYTLSEAFGWHLQDELREIVRSRHDGELLVGQAIVHPSGGAPPWLVYAPTVRTPRSAEGTLNAYLAMRGALLAIRDHNATADRPIQSVAASGLGTGGAALPPGASARQMRYGYEIAAGLRGFADKNLSSLTRRETKLASVPASMREDG